MGYDISAYPNDPRGKGLPKPHEVCTKPHSNHVRQVLRALDAEDLYRPVSGPCEYREYTGPAIQEAARRLREDGYADSHVLGFLDRVGTWKSAWLFFW